ncbi:MAG: endopeptidase La [bacterium]|jgi:ATP-dependent Lon protease
MPEDANRRDPKSGEGQGEEGGKQYPAKLPILALKNVVVFPHLVIPVHVGRERSLAAIDEASPNDKLVGVLTQKNEDIDEPGADDLFKIGTICLILRVLKLPEGGVRVLIQGLSRFEVVEYIDNPKYIEAVIKSHPEVQTDDLEVQALQRGVTDLFREYVQLSRSLPQEVIVAANNVTDPGMLADMVAANIQISLQSRQQILETIPVGKRLEAVTAVLTKEIQLLNMTNKIQSQVQEEVGKSQREYFLREQMKAIRKELGETDEREQETERYKVKIEQAGMPKEVREKTLGELERLTRMHPESAEAGVIRTYLDLLCDLPWSKESEDTIEIKDARKILDEDHYGLEEIKERLLEFLGVLKLRGGDIKGPILCLIGPPGVGKTSLGRSVARALGRKFVRMSLGGVRDEAEIRGHRRTYVGALPGRIIQGIKNAGTRNPVFVLDEIDKVGADFRGDPSSALLEALDPEQNFSFSDHYLEVPFDLSKVLFIATGNMLDTIPPPLRDRMEVIQLPGYTELEKIRIARDFLLPRQMENHGLKREHFEISSSALRNIILNYTREAGLRNLERELAKICRKIALRVAEGEAKKQKIGVPELEKYLGVRKFEFEHERRRAEIGVVTSLFWTAAGGDIGMIEASTMPGAGNLLLTGKLGDVMRESCKAAQTWVRSNAKSLGIDYEEFKNNDLHIHFPAGAIPKDGPSAGVTIATAIVSLFTGKPAVPSVAMTGEITLKGRILPVGGLKEKLLAAKRSGLKKVILPKANETDIKEVPPEILSKLDLVFVENVEEAIPHVLTEKGGRARAAAKKKASSGKPTSAGKAKASKKPAGGKKAANSKSAAKPAAKKRGQAGPRISPLR